MFTEIDTPILGSAPLADPQWKDKFYQIAPVPVVDAAASVKAPEASVAVESQKEAKEVSLESHAEIIQVIPAPSKRQAKKEAKAARKAKAQATSQIKSLVKEKQASRELGLDLYTDKKYPDCRDFNTQRYTGLYSDMTTFEPESARESDLGAVFTEDLLADSRYPTTYNNPSPRFYFAFDEQIDQKALAMQNALYDISIQNDKEKASVNFKRANNKVTIGLMRVEKTDKKTQAKQEFYFCALSGLPDNPARATFRQQVEQVCKDLNIFFINSFVSTDVHTLIYKISTEKLGVSLREDHIINKACVEKSMMVFLLKQYRDQHKLAQEQNTEFEFKVTGFKTIQFDANVKSKEDFLYTVPPCKDCDENRDAFFHILNYGYHFPEFGSLLNLSSSAFTLPIPALEQLGLDAQASQTEKQAQEKAGLHGKWGIDSVAVKIDISGQSFKDPKFSEFSQSFFAKSAQAGSSSNPAAEKTPEPKTDLRSASSTIPIPMNNLSTSLEDEMDNWLTGNADAASSSDEEQSSLGFFA